jgi:flagellar biosynthesis component FlhA
METMKISTPLKSWKIPRKVWIGIAIGVSGLLAFLYWRYRKNQKEAELEKEKETQEKKEEPKEVESPKEELIEEMTEIVVEVPDTQEFLNQALRQNLHLPALSFNPNWDVIPLLPQVDSPVRFRIFNQTGQAPVDVSLEKNADKIAWHVIASGMANVEVPLNDATQLRAVIASFLQQVSPVLNVEKNTNETEQKLEKDSLKDTSTDE